MARAAKDQETGEDGQSTAETEYNGFSVNPKTASASELNGYITEKIEQYRDCAEASNELHYIIWPVVDFFCL